MTYLLLELPNDDANRQEQEETREKYGEEHEKVDMWLILKGKERYRMCLTVHMVVYLCIVRAHAFVPV